MTIATILVLIGHFGSLAVLATYSIHRLFLWLADPGPTASWPRRVEATPFVTVQLPIYNERFVVQRLLEAVARLDYPAERFEVQVLDDSTDETRAVAARGVERLRAAGIDVHHIRRRHRTGYKAGALAEGLERARGEYVLVLDADFEPGPDLIRRLLPPLVTDPGVGMVQARWGHLNPDANYLTRVQVLLLDAHFLVEQTSRAHRGLFFNFNGTAGMWRTRAIRDAGGWELDTLTEDLDLSYRAQLRGWRFVYLPDVVAPAELPDTLAACKQQQARWAQGTIATARKILPRLLPGDWRPAVKLEAFAHLTTHVVFPATLLLAVLAAPSLLLREAMGWDGFYLADIVLGLAAILPAGIYYRAAAHRAGYGFSWTQAVPLLLFAGFALTVSTTPAVWRGLRSRRSAFLRTPKLGGSTRAAPRGYRPTPSRSLRLVEGGMAVYLVGGLLLCVLEGLVAAVPVFALIAMGYSAAALRG